MSAMAPAANQRRKRVMKGIWKQVYRNRRGSVPAGPTLVFTHHGLGGLYRSFCRGLGLRGEISQREFQAAEVRMVVVVEREGNINNIARKKSRLLHSFRQPPSQRLVDDGFSPVLRATGNGCGIGMAAWRHQTGLVIRFFSVPG